MKIIIKGVIFLIGGLIILLFLLLMFFTITAYNPMKELKLTDISDNREINQMKLNSLSILSWNISHSIYHKGRTINKNSSFSISDNLNIIIDTLREEKADVYLLQAVDKNSGISLYINQVKLIIEALPEYNAYFSTNHKALFVPYPIHSPIGKIHSGVLTLSDPISINTKRYSLPTVQPWPDRIFEQNDCLSLIKIPSKNEDAYWYIINLHLSSFNKDLNKINSDQLSFIKDFIIKLYKSGNYVICGGDWNFNIVEIDSLREKIQKNNVKNSSTKDSLDFLPKDWIWAYDFITPTYKDPQKNINTITRDGFLISPNIELIEVKALDFDFVNSPHNPVYIRVKAKSELSIEKNTSPETTTDEDKVAIDMKISYGILK
jgi:endonuclease/exonuclease/phosphatase family metal-dependent hydrolase